MINKVILLGCLGKDPEDLNIQGTSCSKFSVATTESYKDKQGKRQNLTEWHSVIAWRERADFCNKYLKKGSKVYIEGKLKTRSWLDKNETTHYQTDVIVESIKMLDKKENTQEKPVQHQTDDLPYSDDLPF